MPRKAAYFMLIAAETFGTIDCVTSVKANLWLNTVRMFSPKSNTPDTNGNYTWSNLRASLLQALIKENDPSLSEKGEFSFISSNLALILSLI